MPVNVDILKAKDIHRNYIRGTRKPLLEQLDVDFMKALEGGSPTDVANITTQKQLLRDEPANAEIDQASTVDEIKAQWNETLLGPNPYTSGSPGV